MDKTGQGIEVETNLAMRLGNLLEEPVARLYAELTGNVVRRHKRACASCRKAGTEYACDRSAVWDEQYPFLFAHLDRVTQVAPKEPWRVLEIKTSGWPGEDWGPTNTDRIPMRVLIQVILQMRLANLQTGIVAALLWGRELRTYTIHRDPALEESLVDQLDDFWRYVQTRVPLIEVDHPQTGTALRRLYPADDGDLITVTTEDDWALVSEVVAAYNVWKQSDTAYKHAQVAMQARLGEAAGMDWPEGKITWKATNRTDTDWPRVAQWVGTNAIEKGLMDKDEWDAFVADSTTTKAQRRFYVHTKKRGHNGDE
jgi:hypothetical protein